MTWLKALLIPLVLIALTTIACAQTPATVTVTLPGGKFDVPITILPAPPTFVSIAPTVFVDGTATNAVITGTNLIGLPVFSYSRPGITIVERPGRTSTTIPITVTIAPNTAATIGNCNLGTGLCNTPFGPVKIDWLALFQPPKPPFQSSMP